MQIFTRKNTVAEFIASRLKVIDKTHRQIATEIGFARPNVISMFASGTLKLPVKRVAALAKALETDPAHLLRLTLSEYAPEILDAVESVLQRSMLSANELALIDGFREVTGGQDCPSVVVERDGLLELIVLAA